MNTIPEKALKILALALDSAAHDGEWKNAAVMFIASLRKAGYAADIMTAQGAPARPPYAPPKYKPTNPWWKTDSTTRIHFGMHRGKLLSEIPTDYLLWLIDLRDINKNLWDKVSAELRRRNNNNQQRK